MDELPRYLGQSTASKLFYIVKQTGIILLDKSQRWKTQNELGKVWNSTREDKISEQL